MNSNRHFLGCFGVSIGADSAVAQTRSPRLESAHGVQILSNRRRTLHSRRNHHLLRQEFRDWRNVDCRGRGVRGPLAAQDAVNSEVLRVAGVQLSNRPPRRLENALNLQKIKAQHEF
jgi:hypothetical protein